MTKCPKWRWRTVLQMVTHRYWLFVFRFVNCIGTREDINKNTSSFNLEKTSNGKTKYGHFGQKTQSFETFLSTILRYEDWHSGTWMSYGVFNLKTRVWRTHTQILRALDRPQRSWAGQDMISCLNDALVTHRCQKGLKRGTQAIWSVWSGLDDLHEEKSCF